MKKLAFALFASTALASGTAIFYLPAGMVNPYALGLLLGIGSGAAMLPYTVIKEVNPDNVKGSASGAINFLVFTFSALLTPMYGKLLAHIANGGAMNLPQVPPGHRRFAGARATGTVAIW